MKYTSNYLNVQMRTVEIVKFNHFIVDFGKIPTCVGRLCVFVIKYFQKN